MVHARDPEAVVGSFAADHAIADEAAFAAVVAEAVAVARTGLLVTVGIEPTRPATGFGYVRAGDALQVAGAPSALVVEEFVEKPDAATAEQYVATGRYRWNAGMFVARAATVLEMLDEYRPGLGAGLRRLGRAWDTADREAELEAVWPTLERIAFDYAVAEPAAAAGRVAVVPGTFGWDDVGDFAAVGAVLPDAPVQVLGERGGARDRQHGGRGGRLRSTRGAPGRRRRRGGRHRRRPARGSPLACAGRQDVRRPARLRRPHQPALTSARDL